jgi:transcriptional regulator with XRE-family HTH domain
MDKEVSPLAMLRRIRGNVTQEELGEAIGVTGNTVARWERGEVQPRLTPFQVVRLCKFLGITLNEFPESFAPQPIHSSLTQNQN